MLVPCLVKETADLLSVNSRRRHIVSLPRSAASQTQALGRWSNLDSLVASSVKWNNWLSIIEVVCFLNGFLYCSIFLIFLGIFIWAARRSNQSILKEINSEYSLEWLILKLKLQYFGHLMRRADSLENTLIMGNIEGKRRGWWQRMRWLDSITESMGMNLSTLWEIVKDRGAWHAAVHGIIKSQTWLRDWTTTTGLPKLSFKEVGTCPSPGFCLSFAALGILPLPASLRLWSEVLWSAPCHISEVPGGPDSSWVLTSLSKPLALLLFWKIGRPARGQLMAMQGAPPSSASLSISSSLFWMKCVCACVHVRVCVCIGVASH